LIFKWEEEKLGSKKGKRKKKGNMAIGRPLVRYV